MPRCSEAGHLAASTPVALYVTLPAEGRFTGERYRLRFCTRHGHQALSYLIRRGASMLAEQPMPEFCLGCAQPTNDLVFEAKWYEGDWSTVVAYSLCEDCQARPTDVFGEATVLAEKLPPREKMPQEPRQGRKAKR